MEIRTPRQIHNTNGGRSKERPGLSQATDLAHDSGQLLWVDAKRNIGSSHGSEPVSITRGGGDGAGAEACKPGFDMVEVVVEAVFKLEPKLLCCR